jgi:hypothetical protein
MNGNPEMPGQSQKAERTVGVTAPTCPVRAFSASVRGTHVPGARCSRTHSGRRQPGIAPRSTYVLVSAGWLGHEGRSVKLSAQPTLVRTQHLPHISAVQSR